MGRLFDQLDESQGRARVRRFTTVVLAAAMVLTLGTLLYFASRASAERDEALDLQRRSYEVINLVQRVDATLAQSESILARYVVSLEPDEGRRYQDSWRSAGTQIVTLKRFVRDNPQQRVNVAELERAYMDRGRILNDIALRTTYEQRLGALGRFYAAGKDSSLLRLDEMIERTVDTEQQVLDRRNMLVTASEQRANDLTRTYKLAGLVLLLGVLVALWAVNSAYNDRQFIRRLAQSEADRADELEAAVLARTKDLERANERLREEMAERAHAEENLRQMQKMEAVGQLTGGIAHDFNNMLAVVVGGLELAKRRVQDAPARVERHIDSALEGANRAAALTRRLLAFARSEPLMPSHVDPDALILGLAEMIDRTLGDQIVVRLEPGAKGWALWADRPQLESALLNLAVNARDAMEGRGTLTVSTAQRRLRTGEVNGCSAGDYVLIAVRDTGCGMTPEVRARVFEPFYTTKPIGKGTGLGLSQIFGFVGQCGGEIVIHSNVGEGTEVQLYLPRDTAQRPPAREPAGLSPESGAAGIQRTILVVEDDQRVLAATLEALSELGHRAISCDHPHRASALIAAHPEIDLILSDVLMPDMTGPEMVAMLVDQAGHIPVIFVTGFAGDLEDSAALGGHKVLRKPFTLVALARTIEEAAPISPPPARAVAAAG
jgi:signal transduction histidine kinase